MITFNQESVLDVMGEIMPLLQMHNREIEHYQDMELDPDWEFYLSHPGVRVFTVRDDSRLIGYGVFFIGPNRHYKQSVQAVQDILFIHPDYRKGRTGLKLLQYCDDAARQEGAQVIYQHVNAAHSFGPLLERVGYELVEHVYGHRLDKE